ncbi:MAG: carbon-nitrogen hydrolase family protein [Candidatus Latescibacter sp.]|nr:carbon-nitrogen hydrolase family protein [Candidatus Latescibacter sp.]
MLRIGIAQVPQTPYIGKNLDKVLEYMDKAVRAGVELLCFPETHIPGYRVGLLEPDSPVNEDALERASETICAKAKELAMGVIFGTETPNPGGKPFNSAQVVNEKGELLTVHHKSRLTPADARAYAFPQSGPTAFTFKGVPMGVVICFEGFRYPENVRMLAKGGAKIVFHPQCNHFFASMSWKLPVHEALITARAAENTVWFVSANMCHPANNCRSLVVAPNGLIQEASVLGQEMLLTANIDPYRATHAFLKDDLDEMARALGEA